MRRVSFNGQEQFYIVLGVYVLLSSWRSRLLQNRDCS